MSHARQTKAATKTYEVIYVYQTSRFTINVAVEQVSRDGNIQQSGTAFELDPGIYRMMSPAGVVPVGQSDFAHQTFGAKGNPPVDPPLRAQQQFPKDASDGVIRNGLG